MYDPEIMPTTGVSDSSINLYYAIAIIQRQNEIHPRLIDELLATVRSTESYCTALGVLLIFLNPRKLGFARQHPPTPVSIFFIFGNMYKKTTNTKKHKKNSELGLNPLTHFQVFLGLKKKKN